MSNPDYASSPNKGSASTQLTVAAISIMVMACLAFCWSLLDGIGRVMILSGAAQAPQFGARLSPEAMHALSIVFLVLAILVLLLSPVLVVGCIQMLRRRSYGFARISAILAMLPITAHCCCALTLPLGIWALILLNKPEIRREFPGQL